MTPKQSLEGYKGIRTWVLLLGGGHLPEKQNHKQRMQWIAWFNNPKENQPPKEKQ